jgi:hypothetical protein
MGRGGEDEALKPSDLTEAQREALKRQYRCVTIMFGLVKPLHKQSPITSLVPIARS